MQTLNPTYILVDVETCELRRDDTWVDARELLGNIASLSAFALAALKLFRLLSRGPKGNAGIPAVAPPRRRAA